MDHTTTRTKTQTLTRRGPITLEQLINQPTVSVEQASDLIGISRAYAYEMCQDGRLPTVKLGVRRYRVKSAALLKMLGED